MLTFFLVGCANTANTEVLAQHGKAPQQRDEDVKMSQISDAIKAQDLVAVEMARSLGPAAIPELSGFVNHEDPVVSMIALRALGEIAHRDAYEILMNVAQGEDDYNAVTSLDQLFKHLDDVGIDRLVDLLPECQSPAAQRRLVFGVGQQLGPTEAKSLKSFCQGENDSLLAPVCMVVMARLGVERERKAFAQHMLEQRDLESFEQAAYIGQPWLLPVLGRLLRDTSMVQPLNADIPGFPSMLRVCDKAVALIAEISGTRFSFVTNRHMNYTPEQLAEAARVVAEAGE